VLKRCGVTDVLAISAVGSLREELAPGDFVAVDQFIDRTTGASAASSARASWPMSGWPTRSARAWRSVPRAARAAGVRAHRGGCYIAIDGPQFSTRAESALYRHGAPT
jgi:5'-methylthioadenosine phosphorylase